MSYLSSKALQYWPDGHIFCFHLLAKYTNVKKLSEMSIMDSVIILYSSLTCAINAQINHVGPYGEKQRQYSKQLAYISPLFAVLSSAT